MEKSLNNQPPPIEFPPPVKPGYVPFPIKLLFWLLLGITSVILAEVVSFSSPFPFFDDWGLTAVFPLYALHILVLAWIIFPKKTHPERIVPGRDAAWTLRSLHYQSALATHLGGQYLCHRWSVRGPDCHLAVVLAHGDGFHATAFLFRRVVHHFTRDVGQPAHFSEPEAVFPHSHHRGHPLRRFLRCLLGQQFALFRYCIAFVPG